MQFPRNYSSHLPAPCVPHTVFVFKGRPYIVVIHINEAKCKHRWFPPVNRTEFNSAPSEATDLQIPRGENQDKKKSDYSR